MESPNNSMADPPLNPRTQPGATIRRVRLERGVTLRELARRIKLNPSHLSKIERGLANPSVGTLWMVSDELGIPVADLFTHEETAHGTSSVTHHRSPSGQAMPSDDPQPQLLDLCVDPENRETINMAGVQFQRLTPHDDATIEFLEVKHEVGAGDTEAYRHRGREYGICLKGRLQVEVGFRKYILEPGGSIAFESTNPHRVLNVGDEPATAIWVVVGRNQL